MPKIHEYISGNGFYIKSAFEGKITTYQVAPSGESYLRQHGCARDGCEISPKELQMLVRKKYVFTGASGAGEIEDDDEISFTSRPIKQPDLSALDDIQQQLNEMDRQLNAASQKRSITPTPDLKKEPSGCFWLVRLWHSIFKRP